MANTCEICEGTGCDFCYAATKAVCARCGKDVTYDSGDDAWSAVGETTAYAALVCVEGVDEDGADDLGHTVSKAVV